MLAQVAHLEEDAFVPGRPRGLVRAAPGDRCEQPARIVLARRLEHLAHGAALDDAAAMHDRDPIGDVGDHAEIVRDQQQAHAGLGLELLQQLEDLRLHGDVEGGRGLVGDQDVRAQRERHRDHDPLPLAARELMGVVVDAPRRVGNPDMLEQRDRALLGGAPAHRPVRPQRLLDLKPDRVDRIEMRERVLKDDRDPLAIDPAPLGRAHLQKIFPLEQDLPARDVARRGVQDVHDRRCADALARAALAQERERLAAIEVVADPGERVHRALRGVELDREIPDFEQVVRLSHRVASGSRVASAVGGRSRAAPSPRAN